MAAALLLATSALAQTTAGTSVTIVVPVAAATSSFVSQATAYNPNGVAIAVTVGYYDAQNLANPGLKPCLDLNVPANRSVQFTLGSQCALGAGNHFGLLILSEQSGTRPFYGYVRTENTLGIGFSSEGFPVEHFNDQVQHATGLKRTAAGAGAPATQTNCFAATLGDAVDYQLRLFNDATGAQLGNTLNRTLQAHQLFRYLDVFAGADGVGAPAGDHVNVRAEFTNLSGAHRKLIGVCTVQENTALSADFRIAKSYGSPFFLLHGGNAFGATAVLGTTDGYAVEVNVNGARAMRYAPATVPNLTGGHSSNTVVTGVRGGTIGGGGVPGDSVTLSLEGGIDMTLMCAAEANCGNRVKDWYGTIGGGAHNRAGDGVGFLSDRAFATVGGGFGNAAEGLFSTVGGGSGNGAGDYASVGGGLTNVALGFGAAIGGGAANIASGSHGAIGGGYQNVASGDYSIAGGRGSEARGDYSIALGRRAKTFVGPNNGNGTIVLADSSNVDFADSTDNRFSVRATGGVRLVTAIDGTGAATAGVSLLSGDSSWNVISDRAAKANWRAVDGSEILAKVVVLPIGRWHYKAQSASIEHMGPSAQDFRAAFGLGHGDTTISTVDADGVALAAIQGLHRLTREENESLRGRLQAQETELSALRAELAAYRAELAGHLRRLAELERQAARAEPRHSGPGYPAAKTAQDPPGAQAALARR